MTQILKACKRFFAYWPLHLIWIPLPLLLWRPVFLLLIPIGIYATLRGTLGLVQFLGPVYWILRPDTRWLRAGIGTMHQTAAPWRKGRGLYVVCCRRMFQIGLCQPQHLDDEAGTLSALQGRFLDMTPKEIGEW